MDRFDKYWIGILIGLILPALFAYIYIDQMNLWYTLQTFGWKGMSAVMGKLTIVALFPNMALLFLFYTLNVWNLAKGVIFAMLPYIILALIIIA